MKDQDNLIRVYTGTEIAVKLLKDELAKIGISALIKNDYNSGIIAGFATGTASSVDLFIQIVDMNKAEPIINGFIELNKG
ncbi:MAG: DUF2007 domain-containing protein [Bacteroidales bacterium]|nr:DUF2007 domain-containing protein [Bacteroidales bacterium]